MSKVKYFSLIALLLLTGCSQDVSNTSETSNVDDISKPSITTIQTTTSVTTQKEVEIDVLDTIPQDEEIKADVVFENADTTVLKVNLLGAEGEITYQLNGDIVEVTTFYANDITANWGVVVDNFVKEYDKKRNITAEKYVLDIDSTVVDMTDEQALLEGKRILIYMWNNTDRLEVRGKENKIEMNFTTQGEIAVNDYTVIANSESIPIESEAEIGVAEELTSEIDTEIGVEKQTES